MSSTDDTGSLPNNGHIAIREMEIGDLAPIYDLGERLFTRRDFPVLYRTWDSFEVTHYYDSDPEYCLVAEGAGGTVIGFALGSTVEKDRSAWKYGYLAWLGVAPEYQGTKVADRLLKEFEKRIKEAGVRILLVDTEADNYRAIRFFQDRGFAQPKNHVWLSKSLSRHHHNGTRPLVVSHTRLQKRGKGQQSTPGAGRAAAGEDL